MGFTVTPFYGFHFGASSKIKINSQHAAVKLLSNGVIYIHAYNQFITYTLMYTYKVNRRNVEVKVEIYERK